MINTVTELGDDYTARIRKSTQSRLLASLLMFGHNASDYWSDIPVPSESVFLYGAGGFGRFMLKGLRELGYDVIGFLDSNSALWDTEIDGLKVLSPDCVNFLNPVINCVWNLGESSNDLAIRSALQQDTKLISAMSFMMRYPEKFLPYWFMDEPSKLIDSTEDIWRAFDLLADQTSRSVFIRDIELRLFLNQYARVSTSNLNYFDPALMPLTDSEVFYDCGAYDGDSVRAFIKATNSKWGDAHYKAIHSIESDYDRYQELHMWAMATRTEALHMYPWTAQQFLKRCYAFSVHAYEPPTLIKMDIEGAEMDALRAAAQIIKDHQPKLAICCYHTQGHLWEIPNYISTLGNYTFKMAHHGTGISDTVLYCVPKENK